MLWITAGNALRKRNISGAFKTGQVEGCKRWSGLHKNFAVAGGTLYQFINGQNLIPACLVSEYTTLQIQ